MTGSLRCLYWFFFFFGAFIFVFENSAGRDILIAAVNGRMFGCKARYACFCHGASWPRAEYHPGKMYDPAQAYTGTLPNQSKTRIPPAVRLVHMSWKTPTSMQRFGFGGCSLGFRVQGPFVLRCDSHCKPGNTSGGLPAKGAQDYEFRHI